MSLTRGWNTFKLFKLLGKKVTYFISCYESVKAHIKSIKKINQKINKSRVD